MNTPHQSLKCDRCLSCIREGGEVRRLGSMAISIWTRVGPYNLTLCGDCAKPVRVAIGEKYIDVDEAINEQP
jgi:hypothetical protein